MLNKKYLLIYICLIMFSFFNKTQAKYDKVFFDLSIKSINNDVINLSEFRGKTVLLVNVASKCGFTKQYTELQTIYEKYKERKPHPIGFFSINDLMSSHRQKLKKDSFQTHLICLKRKK